MKFELKGKFEEKKQEKKFIKVIEAKNENFAREKLLSLFGSKNKIKRNKIKIESVSEYKEKKR